MNTQNQNDSNEATPPSPQEEATPPTAGEGDKTRLRGIETVFRYIEGNVREEMARMTQADLERFWFFEWDLSRPPEYNLYEFHSMLTLYQKKCRQWEEMHNGSECVVEHVRDIYLTPKIQGFLAKLTEVLQPPPESPRYVVATLRQK